jgi:ribose transport system ATP-binding protein
MAAQRPAESGPLLMMTGIVKTFPGVTALDDVSLRLHSGEILGLVGENGAGKSTLMNILAGIHVPDRGEISVAGERVRLGSVDDALAHGVAVIHQELNLAGNLDVAANIFLGREPTRRAAVVNGRRLYADARRLMALVGLNAAPTAIVDDLPLAQQQLVEIARALSTSARILVLDEPTSALSDQEVQRLFDVMRTLKSQGVGMIYISHRLHEIEVICDRVTVLRDGRNTGELVGAEIKRDAMVRLMVGREVTTLFPGGGTPDMSRPVLSVRGLRRRRSPGVFSFDAYPGETLGIAGLAGAGRTELLRALFGVEPIAAGEVCVDGKPVHLGCPLDAIRHGIALVPEDRKALGLVLEMSVKENISLPALVTSSSVLLHPARETDAALCQVQDLGVKTPSIEQAVQYLSGGNQQKVVLGKWLARAPRVLLLDEPTRGIDVGAKSDIYRLIRALTDRGMAILMISSQLEEIIGLCDRVLVIHEGRPRGILLKAQLTEEAIMHLATGGHAA